MRNAPTSASTRREALVISATPSFHLPTSNPGVLEVGGRNGSSKGRDRIVKEPPECGDASACLMLRTPVIRRDRCRLVQKMCPVKSRGSWPDFAELDTGAVSWRGQNSGVDGQPRLSDDGEKRQDQNACTSAILARPIRTSSVRHW